MLRAKPSSGTWKALLSSSTVNAKDRVTLVYPVVRADTGVVVAASNLWSGTIATAIANIANFPVWTGSTTAGLKTGIGACSDWSSTAGTEGYGYAASTDYGWVAYTSSGCNSTRALYCVEQ